MAAHMVWLETNMANIADAPDSVEDAEDGEGAKKKSRFKLNLKGLGKKQLMMIGGAAVLLIGLGVGAFMFLGGHEEEAATEAEKHPVVFVDLPDMMVNLLAPADRPKYLKVKI